MKLISEQLGSAKLWEREWKFRLNGNNINKEAKDMRGMISENKNKNVLPNHVRLKPPSPS